MNIKTERLAIKEFSRDMAMAVHKNSLDEDTGRFLPVIMSDLDIRKISGG